MVGKLSQIPVSKKTVVFTKPSSDMTFLLNLYVSTYKKLFSKALLMQRSMKWLKMFLFLTKVLYFLQTIAYSCIDGLSIFLGYVTHKLKMLARKTLL